MSAAESLLLPQDAGAIPAGDPGSCPVDHERVKWTAAWDQLAYVGLMPSCSSGHPDLELRNCACGTTLCKPVPIVPDVEAVIAAVPMDATDALAAGQTIRALARDRKTPHGVRELFARVGQQMTAAAREALATAGKAVR